MAPSASDFGLALASGSNKNSLSLISSSFDFAIIKFDAPPEYAGLGKALSPRRKKEAEDGQLHTVARKLTMLFADELPEVPQLSRAYGTRASEIAKIPSINPRGTTGDGAFKDLIGLDGTTVWAAATSGKGALPVHLLACMLARIWKAPQAIAIWEEVVEARKYILSDRFGRDAFHINDATAARIEVPREQLAEWDGSARAWLASGDMAFKKEQTQVKLIIDNLNLALNSGKNVYKIVMEAWTGAMSFMENITSGMPQTVSGAEVLLALSSWHLYPDMVVLRGGTQVVQQKDDLIPSGGVVTLGLHNQTSTNNFGITWSLPLSHLRYYGKPAVSTGIVSLSTSRISTTQLGFVVLGVLIAGWTDVSTPLESCLKLFPALHAATKGAADSRLPSLTQLATTANLVLKLTGTDRKNAERLITLGGRRCRSFFSAGKEALPRAFGLLQPDVFLSCIKGTEAKISWLRQMYGDHGKMQGQVSKSWNLSDALIRYTPAPYDYPYVATREILVPDESEGHDYRHYPLDAAFFLSSRNFEYASLFPRASGQQQEQQHCRWIQMEEDERVLSESDANRGSPELVPSVTYQLKSTSNAGDGSSDVMHRIKIPGMRSVSRKDAERFLQLQARTREKCGLIGGASVAHLGSTGTLAVKSSLDTISSVPTQGAFIPGTVSQRLIELNVERAFCRTTNSDGYANPATHSPTQQHIREILLSRGVVPVGDGAFMSPPIPRYRQRLATRPSRLQAEILSKERIVEAELARLQKESRDAHELEVSRPSSTIGEACFFQDQRSQEESSTYRTAPVFWTCVGLKHDCPYLWYTANPFPWDELPGNKTYERVIGAADSAIYAVRHADATFIEPMSMEDLLNAFEQDLLDVRSIINHLAGFWSGFNQHYLSLAALEIVADVYAGLQEAEVELAITTIPLNTYHWCQPQRPELAHARSLACVAAFESGGLNVNPLDLKDALGISNGNSIYVASHYFTDPWDPPPESTLKRIVGNVGKPGMAFLVSPTNPEWKEADIAKWQEVTHADFDGRLENSFDDTSAHLSFTGYEQTYNTGDHGLVTREAFFIQAVVKAYDRGEWVADLNMVGAMSGIGSKPLLLRLKDRQECDHSTQEAADYSALMPITSIDTWAEYFDPPGNLCVVRAAGDWLARLSFATVALQQLRHVIVAPSSGVCWACVAEIRCNLAKAVVVC